VTDTANVYIANGMGGMRFLLPALAEASGTFRVYCHMAEQPDNVLQGDVWITDPKNGSRLCGVMTDVRFKKLRADIFHRLMADHAVAPAPGHAHSKAPAPVRASKPVAKPIVQPIAQPVAQPVAPVPVKPKEEFSGRLRPDMSQGAYPVIRVLDGSAHASTGLFRNTSQEIVVVIGCEHAAHRTYVAPAFRPDEQQRHHAVILEPCLSVWRLYHSVPFPGRLRLCGGICGLARASVAEPPCRVL
jgi:hypothetical protein